MNHLNHLIQLSAAAVLLGAAQGASAETIVHTFQQGVAGYTGQVDTNIRGEEPDTAGGSLAELSIDASDGGFESQVLLRFDNVFGAGAGQIGADRVITSATLSFVVTSAGSGIRFHEMLLPWSDATATFNGFGLGVQTDGIEARLASVQAIGGNDGNSNVESGTLVVDFTAAMQRAQAGFAPQGWALLPWLPDGTNGIDVYSAEWDTLTERPLLTITTAPVPEPAAWLMMALGLAGLAARARRQRV
jgi:hypothetical protein